MPRLEQVNKCNCGAVVIEILVSEKKPTEKYQMAQETYDKHFAFLGDRDDYHYDNCNRCMNGWAIDIDPDNPEDENGDTITIEPDEGTIQRLKNQL